MKNLTALLILAALALMASRASAQTHLRGQPYVQLEAGSYDTALPSLNNFALKAGVGKYTRRLWGSMFFVSVAHKQTWLVSEGSRVLIDTPVPVDQYMAGYQLTPNLYQSAMRTFLIKLPLSLQAGYESINRNRDFAGPYLLIPPGPYKPELNAERWYAVPLTVYLRPVSAAGAASYQITFDTDTYGYLEIAGDRLFPGDKITLPYAAFKDYRLGVRFVTPIAGAQRVRLTAVSGQQTRQADTNFTIN